MVMVMVVEVMVVEVMVVGVMVVRVVRAMQVIDMVEVIETVGMIKLIGTRRIKNYLSIDMNLKRAKYWMYRRSVAHEKRMLESTIKTEKMRE